MRLRLITLFLASACLGCALHAEAVFDCDARQSRIDVMVNATLGSFVGHLDRFDSSIIFDAAGNVAAAQMKFCFINLKTGREKRDRDLHAWQETDLFPEGQFVLKSVSMDKSGHALATGELMFHGHTHTVSFPFSLITENSTCAMDGEALLDTRDYGLPVLRVWSVVKVDPLVRVRFHLQGRKVIQ